MGSQPAWKCWDGPALNRRSQGRCGKPGLRDAPHSAPAVRELEVSLSCFKVGRNQTCPLLFLDQLCCLTRACLGFLQQPHSTTEHRFPARGPLGTPCHYMKSCIRETSKVDTGLQPRAGRTEADPEVSLGPGCGLISLTSGLSSLPRGAGCASPAEACKRDERSTRTCRPKGLYGKNAVKGNNLT